MILVKLFQTRQDETFTNLKDWTEPVVVSRSGSFMTQVLFDLLFSRWSSAGAGGDVAAGGGGVSVSLQVAVSPVPTKARRLPAHHTWWWWCHRDTYAHATTPTEGEKSQLLCDFKQKVLFSVCLLLLIH